MIHTITKIVHSESKPAWNIINTRLGGLRKLATVPYTEVADEDLQEQLKKEAYERAAFISACFNNSLRVCKILNIKQ